MEKITERFKKALDEMSDEELDDLINRIKECRCIDSPTVDEYLSFLDEIENNV